MFVCYAHKDSSVVFSDIEELNRNGVNIWYDEGIEAGSSWRGGIATAITGANKFLFFVSKSSLASTHCLREVDYALNHNIDIIPIYLDNTPLPAELDLSLSRVQALFRDRDPRYIEHLLTPLLDGKSAAQPSKPTRKFESRKLGITITVSLCLILAIAWTQRESLIGTDVKGSATADSVDAFGPYLQGLELMKRWDKGENLGDAIQLFERAAELNPDFALAYARLAEALRMRYALTGKISWLDDAANAAATAQGLNPDLAAVQVAIGKVHLAKGNMEIAHAALQKAMDIDPYNPESNRAIATMYARQGRAEDAEAAFRKAIALDPENLLSLDAYAHFLSDQSRLDEAAKQWQDALALAPDHYAVLVNLGATFADTGQVGESVTIYKRAIEIKPNYMAYVNLAIAYHDSGHYSAAVTALEEALSIDDVDWLAWGNLAFVYAHKNGLDQQTIDTFEKAIELAEDARKQYPRDPFVHSDLAMYYATTDQPELAIQRLETALTLSPNSGEVAAAAAEAYETIGQREKALVLLKTALDLGYSMRRLQSNNALDELMLDPRMQ